LAQVFPEVLVCRLVQVLGVFLLGHGILLFFVLFLIGVFAQVVSQRLFVSLDALDFFVFFLVTSHNGFQVGLDLLVDELKVIFSQLLPSLLNLDH
jgi:hypothetical protein